MRFRNWSIAISLLLALSGCGPSQTDFNKLAAENASLKKEVDELRNGESRLVAEIDKAYADKNYATAKEKIKQLSLKHPESMRNADYKVISAEIEQGEADRQAQKLAEEKEALRIKNLSNTGIWSIRSYVDNFGEKTKTRYITNPTSIEGTFSNTATQDSPLNVTFLINGSSNISIQLYEYAGTNPVKGAGYRDNYAVLVKDTEGDKMELDAFNYQDRLTLNERDSKKLHHSLMKGGHLQFRIFNRETTTTQYQFTVANAEFYENAFRMLTSQ